MEGKIDSSGYLWIKRGSKLKQQDCPYMPDATYCGDVCPHFQEPYKTNITLTCGAGVTWEFTKFADERG